MSDAQFIVAAPRVALGYWLDIPFVFPRNSWNAATVSIFEKVLGSSL